MISQDIVDRQQRILERFNLPTKAIGIPIEDIEDLLKRASYAGIKILIDFHEIVNILILTLIPRHG